MLNIDVSSRAKGLVQNDFFYFSCNAAYGILFVSDNDSVTYTTYIPTLTDGSQEWYLSRPSDYGCREYWEIPYSVDRASTCVNTNCFGYAMGRRIFWNPLFATGVPNLSTENNTQEMVAIEAKAVFESSIHAEKVGGSILDWAPIDKNTPIEEMQYRIVLRMRCMEDLDGDGKYDGFEFHFWYQTSSGRWAHKNGTEASQLLPEGVTPETKGSDGWTLNNDSDFYNSDIFYYAITPRGGLYE